MKLPAEGIFDLDIWPIQCRKGDQNVFLALNQSGKVPAQFHRLHKRRSSQKLTAYQQFLTLKHRESKDGNIKSKGYKVVATIEKERQFQKSTVAELLTKANSTVFCH